jgi:hypothetical protein
MNIIDIIIGIFIGSVLGYFVGKTVMLFRMRHFVAKMVAAFDEVSDEPIIITEVPTLNTQRVNETIYLYEKSTFVCQGTSIEEVAKNFLIVRPIKIASVKHDDTEIWFVDGEVRTSLA